MLRGLLETPISNLGGGFPVVTTLASGTSVRLDSVLGHGGSSTVYRAVIGGIISAVKIITNGTFAATESAALQRLGAAGVAGVPRIVCDISEKNIIATSPVGCAFAATSLDVEVVMTAHRAGLLPSANQPRLFNQRFLHDALVVLQSLHRYGVIHGDPRITNFIIVDEVFESPAAALSVSSSASLHADVRETCVAIDFGCAILGNYDNAGALWTYTPRNPAVWVSLPYAPPEQLRAFANNTEYQPKPCHDLFMLAASLYRLLGHNAPQARDQDEALVLANYWEQLMGSSDHVSACAGGPDDNSAISMSNEGHLFAAACAYNIPYFERAAAEMMRSYAVDWPQR